MCNDCIEDAKSYTKNLSFMFLAFIGLLVLSISMCGCTSPDDASRAIRGVGLTPVKVERSFTVYSCRDGEQGYKFVALNADKKKAAGVACCDIYSCSVRF